MVSFLGLALVTALAISTPAAAAEVDVVDNAFNPESERITVGETLIWRFVDGNHTVTADAGQSESFESDPGESALTVNHQPGETFSHVFSRAGTYRYHCRVHAGMTGTVTVDPAPTADTTGPALTRVRVKPKRVCPRKTDTCGRTKAYVRFTLFEAATVVGHIDRRKDGKWKPRRAFDFEALAGKTRKRLPTKNLPPGRYRLRLRAFDESDNPSKTVKRRFRVRSAD